MSTLLRPEVRAAVEARLARLQPDSERRWGQMSAGGAICHLSDAFRMALDERPIAPIHAPLKPLVKLVALRLPLPWPGGRIRTLPEAEQGKGGTPPTTFEHDRAELLTLIRRFAAAPPGALRREHPMFGRMSRADWGRWAYRHMDHHLRQFGA